MTNWKYEDDKIEADSIMAWLDRRLEWASAQSIPLYVTSFKGLWLDAFGTLDSIPDSYKDKVRARFEELRRRRSE